ncbi:MAG: hypothetical protein Ct9H300mP23_03060 [Nitrospinota bacterium]|nr:MAG: hypothetical protein Ct9H300mP23_03060 [Nitrospinota bacterium]
MGQGAEFLKRLDEFNRFSEGTSHNRISSGNLHPCDVVKEINQVLNEDREEFTGSSGPRNDSTGTCCSKTVVLTISKIWSIHLFPRHV